jgi:hypothetical protein
MLSNFLKQSSRMVLDVLSEEYLNKNTTKYEVTSNAGQAIKNDKILKVLRNNVGCIQVPLEAKDKVLSSSTSIYAPTLRSPVYFIEGTKIFIKPDPTGTQKGEIYYNPLPSPVHTETAIDNFPDEAEYAVVIGAAVKVLQYRLNKALHEDEDIELANVMQGEMKMLNNMFMTELTRLNGSMMNVDQGAPDASN